MQDGLTFSHYETRRSLQCKFTLQVKFDINNKMCQFGAIALEICN